MDDGRRYKTHASETNDFTAHSTTNGISTSLLTFVLTGQCEDQGKPALIAGALQEP